MNCPGTTICYLRWSHQLAAWLLAFCLGTLNSGFTVAAEPPRTHPHEFTSDGHSNIGVKECAACHSAPSPIYKALGITRFVRMVEAKEWLERDKHAYAYQLVRQDLSPDELKKEERWSNKLSVDITERMNWKSDDGKFERSCLTCHVGRIDGDHSLKTDYEFGVQCESCHGPGSEYSEIKHHQQVSWRTKTPAQKSQLGMIDLTSPSVTTSVCLSCHLGDISKGRFVTHEMYAAGHPALPPFDLQVFLNAMPPHWRTLQQKPPFEKQAEYNRVHFDIAGNTDEIQSAIMTSYDNTRRSMIGGLVSNDLGIELIHQVAADSTRWGDYANYNCMGCHQELKRNNNPVRLGSRIPGRPFPANWLTLEYPIVHRSGRETHETLTQAMLVAFNSVPFGDVQRLNQLSEQQFKSLSDRFQDRRVMEKQAMSKKDVERWLEYLVNIRRDSLADYWVAKQTAWMVCVAVEELVEHGDLQRNSVAQMQKELAELLQLNLQSPQRQSVLLGQKSVFESARSFDPARCNELLSKMVQAAKLDNGRK